MSSKESMSWKTALIFMALIGQVSIGNALFDRNRGIKDEGVIIAGVFFSILALYATYYALAMIKNAFNKQHDELRLKPARVGAFLIRAGVLLAGTTLVGIALFDRSRDISDGVVIAAGVFLVLFALATIIGIDNSFTKDEPAKAKAVIEPMMQPSFIDIDRLNVDMAKLGQRCGIVIHTIPCEKSKWFDLADRKESVIVAKWPYPTDKPAISMAMTGCQPALDWHDSQKEI